MNTYVFKRDGYYPYSAVVVAATEQDAIRLITNAIRKEYPDLDVDGSDARRTMSGQWPDVQTAVSMDIFRLTDNAPILFDRS